MQPNAVYIHIPFCSHKCYYCDFTAYVVDGQPVEQYLTALEQEMKMWVEEVPPTAIQSVFIGGGTPTILSIEQMKRLLAMVDRYFPIHASCEWTVEANPETTSEELLHVMKEEGVNRLSFGAQTFHLDLLQQIGRIHGVQEIIDSIAIARKVGFSNLSLDLMFGLPNQRVIDLEETIQQAASLNPDHFSCYSLKVEEGTRFHYLEQQGKLPLPNEEAELEMYQLARKLLPQHGYQQYEISNFAREGMESIHNSTYWRNQTFYGLGAGAHGYINHQRYANQKVIREYIKVIEQRKRPIVSRWDVDKREMMENFMIMGLRLMEGVSRADFQMRYHLEMDQVFGEELERLKKQGLLMNEEDRVRLTEQGILFGNEVFAAFLS
ncbi:oxygen-independent coproporphyrinogen-3 oxidase [Seinonella peptonophila]|uniref:Heme chaperone HemW n=1 Tax=Seinonella peptonophila TaxID=112248 RepID=A0A1M4V8W7_9BACL|nr:radical SAM family heme chaperone HemW [Seinonella peptonophila]SHE65313.1 oxygen-independent coproporphyrinogen-3 oxidase [Seinonella peptonophila]